MPEVDSKKGRKMSKWLIMGTLVFILVGGGTFATLKFFVSDTVSASMEEHGTKKGRYEGVGPMFPLRPFIVNLADDEGKRYLKITMELELDEEKVSEELNKRLAQIRDTILILLTSKRFDDIKDVPGKFRLRDQIVKRVNTYLDSGKVRQVYFTEFVIQ
jgi:flagellar FliL protein